MPEPAASGSGRLPAGAAPGRQPRALPAGSVLQSTPARAHLPAVTCLLKCHTGRAAWAAWPEPGPAFCFPCREPRCLPAPARFGDEAEPLTRCPGQQQPSDAEGATGSCLLFPEPCFAARPGTPQRVDGGPRGQVGPHAGHTPGQRAGAGGRRG